MRHKIIIGTAIVLVSVSLLNPGGLIIGAILAGLWLVITYGGWFGIKLKMQRDFGRNARTPDVRDRISGTTDELRQVSEKSRPGSNNDRRK